MDAAQKKVDKKLLKKIMETQGFLHVVSHHASGGKSKKSAEHPELETLGGARPFQSFQALLGA